MALEGAASGLSHGGVGVRSSCQDSCLKEDQVLTLVEFYRRVEFAWTSRSGVHFSHRVAREVCRESTRFRQARKPLLPACGRMARSARRSTPRPSRRFAMCTIEQCALTFPGTIAFCVHLFWRTALFFRQSVVSTFAFALVFSMFPVSWPDTAPFRSCPSLPPGNL